MKKGMIFLASDQLLHLGVVGEAAESYLMIFLQLQDRTDSPSSLFLITDTVTYLGESCSLDQVVQLPPLCVPRQRLTERTCAAPHPQTTAGMAVDIVSAIQN